MAEFSSLLIKENLMRNRFDRFIENGKKTPLAKRTQGFYEQKIHEFRKLWSDYCDIDEEIQQVILENATDNTQKYIEENKYGLAEAKFSEYIGELAEGLRKVTPTIEQEVVNNPPIQTTTVIQQESSLPKITIPKYGGDYDTWRSFRDLFISVVHNNVKLTPVQKLYHLKSCLVGDAEKLLRHTPITDADYNPAWKKLTERYENKRILVNHQLKILVNQQKITTEKIKDIKSLIDTTSECLQQLQSLEVDTSSWDVLIVHILVQKLPYLTLRLWEEDQGTTQDLPKYSSFNEFLEKRLKILEAISDTVAQGAINTKSSTKGHTHTHLSTEANRCPACNENHYILNCKKYRQFKGVDKLKVIKASGRCTNCFSKQHFVKDCSNITRCFKCKQKHHTTLHDAFNTIRVATQSSHHGNQGNYANRNLKAEESWNHKEGNSTNARVINDTDESSITQAFITREEQQALLPTALVIAKSENGDSHTIRCLLDTGSQSSFITEEACKKLKATSRQTSTSVTGLNTCHAAFASRMTTLTVRPRETNNFKLKEEFFIIKQITNALPTRTVAKVDCQHLKGLTLADPTFWKPGKIDALLGAQTFAKIIQEGVRRGHATAPVALNTMFGWVVLGSTSRSNTNNTSTFTVTTCDDKLEKQLKQFWDIEEVASKRILTEAEEECQNMYDATTQRLKNGKHRVKLPFTNNNKPILGQSRNQAIKRYTQLQRQLSVKPELAMEYKKCLNEYLDLDHMEAIDPPNDSEPYYYIPHHAVLKESTTTKVRVDFDVSAKTTNGYSLNEQMLKGPTIQPKLESTLLNWRKYKVALNADIEKMYRRIEIHPDHRTYQRIIWEHPITKKMKDFQLKTVTFGAAAAPFLAIRTLQQLAKDERNNWPKAAAEVNRAFYVDDVLTGADNITEAAQPQHKCRFGKTNHEERILKRSIFFNTTKDNFLTRYSSYHKLLRIVATLLRCKQNCQQSKNKNVQPISCIEIQLAENAVLKILQQMAFPQEYSCLLRKKPISLNSKLVKLTPFMDSKGLIRIGGRLENASCSYNRKHPIILPHAHYVTSILIDKVHQQTLHGGTALVLNTLRNKFWVFNARPTITSNIHKCVKCIRQRSILHKQLMGNLPTVRVNISKPNIQVGEIALIKSEQLQPTICPLGIVEKVYPGQDGLVRVAQVRTKNGSCQRPIAKLCRLPVNQSET